MSSQQLPLTVQDDIQAKTRQPKQGISTYFNPRRIRLWILLVCVFMSTVALMKYNNRYSQKAKKILKEYKLKPFKIVEVDKRDDDYEIKMALKDISDRETFPNIFINGQTLGGSDNLEELHNRGELERILADNHLLI
ncbi:hypothetical protein BCV72DRAFT_257981 [Rhizopus microsporus var. microsporus]|uniref:Glutaredoxin domain-containing protein n=1 Tax=Rhizopus microsporus var. microsporus TaxID=86635 RepID=A0A1X0QTL7_RHIZD|nr:hypothetical protein BCV72DRAFT_257981 [Rhizopus microsporus var. microsporus]